jgi:fumarate reductase subunit D
LASETKEKKEKIMTNLKLLSAAAIATAMLTTPVLAKQHRVHHVRHVAEVAVPAGAHYVNGRLCVPAPRVDAYATAPWENETPCEP